MSHEVKQSQLAYKAFLNRENKFRHHYYDEEMLQYELLKKGDPQAVEEGKKMFSSSLTGHLSDDPLRNIKYLFVASITLATRFAIEGGMNAEKAYNASDLYINKMDLCTSIEQVRSLQADMFSLFTTEVAEAKKESIYSKPVLQSMDYIDENLHHPITVREIAAAVGLNESYLSVLFKKEVHLTISDYIRKLRVETAENMLKYSSYTLSQISTFLAFSSQSYFIKTFKDETGYTPKEYRKKYYRSSFEAGQENVNL